MIAIACFFRLTRVSRAPFAFRTSTFKFLNRVRVFFGSQYDQRLLDFVCYYLVNCGVLDQTIGLIRKADGNGWVM